MNVYIIIYLLVIFTGWIEINFLKKKNEKLIFLLLTFIFMSFLFGLTYTNGGDWTEYENHYYNLEKIIDKNNNLEFGYTITVYFFKKILGLKFEVFRFGVITVVIYFYMRLIFQYSRNILPVVAFLIPSFFFINLLEPIMRQLIAAVIIYNSIIFLQKRKFLNYTILIIIASLFHKTAILMLFLIFLKKRINFNNFLMVLFTIILSEPYYGKIIEVMVTKINFLANYTKYLNPKELTGTDTNVINYVKNIVRFLIQCIPIYYFKNKIVDEKSDIIYNLSLIYVLFLTVSNRLFLLNRIAIYFIPFYFILISYFFENFISKLKKNLIYLAYSIFYLMIFFNLINKNQERYPGRYIPYNNYIWEVLNDREFQNFKEKIEISRKRLYL